MIVGFSEVGLSSWASTPNGFLAAKPKLTRGARLAACLDPIYKPFSKGPGGQTLSNRSSLPVTSELPVIQDQPGRSHLRDADDRSK